MQKVFGFLLRLILPVILMVFMTVFAIVGLMFRFIGTLFNFVETLFMDIGSMFGTCSITLAEIIDNWGGQTYGDD